MELEEVAEPSPSSSQAPRPAADPLLAQLYGSERPPVELLPGVALSPLVSTCWLPKAAKVLAARVDLRPRLGRAGGVGRWAHDAVHAHATHTCRQRGAGRALCAD